MCHFAVVFTATFLRWAKSGTETSALLLREALQNPKPSSLAHSLCKATREACRLYPCLFPARGRADPRVNASKSAKRLSRVGHRARAGSEHGDAPLLRIAHPQTHAALS